MRKYLFLNYLSEFSRGSYHVMRPELLMLKTICSSHEIKTAVFYLQILKASAANSLIPPCVCLRVVCKNIVHIVADVYHRRRRKS